MEKAQNLLEHDFAVTGWALLILKEIRDDVCQNLDGDKRMAIERVISKLHVHPNPNSKVAQISLLTSSGKNLVISKINLDPMDYALAGFFFLMQLMVTHTCGMNVTLCLTLTFLALLLAVWPQKDLNLGQLKNLGKSRMENSQI